MLEANGRVAPQQGDSDLSVTAFEAEESGKLMNQGSQFYSHAVLAFLLLGVAGCSSFDLPARPGIWACEVGDRPMARDTLYFGRNRPNGGVVREIEWRRFLNEIITPRFPDGLTVVNATGQWRNANGQIEQEESKIVTVLHAGDSIAQGKITEIVAEYRGRFDQEAVLRERTTTCARF